MTKKRLVAILSGICLMMLSGCTPNKTLTLEEQQHIQSLFASDVIISATDEVTVCTDADVSLIEITDKFHKAGIDVLHTGVPTDILETYKTEAEEVAPNIYVIGSDALKDFSCDTSGYLYMELTDIGLDTLRFVGRVDSENKLVTYAEDSSDYLSASVGHTTIPCVEGALSLPCSIKYEDIRLNRWRKYLPKDTDAGSDMPYGEEGALKVLQEECPDYTFEKVFSSVSSNSVLCVFKNEHNMIFTTTEANYSGLIQDFAFSSLDEALHNEYTRYTAETFFGDDCIFDSYANVVYTKTEVSLELVRDFILSCEDYTDIQVHSGITEADYELLKSVSCQIGDYDVLPPTYTALPQVLSQDNSKYKFWEVSTNMLCTAYYVKDNKLYFLDDIAYKDYNGGEAIELDGVQFSTASVEWEDYLNIALGVTTESCYLNWEEYF